MQAAKVEIEISVRDKQNSFPRAAAVIKTQAKGIEKSLENVEAKARKTEISLGTLAKAAGGLYVFSKVAGFLRDSVKAAGESAEAMARVESTIRSTGGAAGVTALELKDMASELQRVTAFEDDAILTGQSMLLTFTKIGEDVFPQATEAMLNMSTAMGSDLKSSAIQLGKALNDPIEGVAALRRVGVQLTGQQEGQIKKFIEMGDIASAQKVILGELETQMGGLARAVGATTAGKLAQFGNMLGDIKEEIGGPILQSLGGMVDMFGVLSDNIGGTNRVMEIARSTGKGVAQVFAFTGLVLTELMIPIKTVGQLLQTWMIEGALGVEHAFDKASITLETFGRVAYAVATGKFKEVGKIFGEQAAKLEESDRIFAEASRLNWEGFSKNVSDNLDTSKAAWESYMKTLVGMEAGPKAGKTGAPKPPSGGDPEADAKAIKEQEKQILDARRAMEDSQVGLIQNKTEQHLQALDLRHSREMESVQGNKVAQDLLTQAYFNDEKAILEAHSSELSAIRLKATIDTNQKEYEENKRNAARQKEIDELRVEQAYGTAGNLLQAGQLFFAQTRKNAILLKTLAIGEIAVNTARLVMKTLGDGGPFALPLALSMGALGAAQAYKVSEQKFANGGIVEGQRSGDRVPVRANGGELFMNSRQQANTLMAIANGGGGGMTHSGDVNIQIAMPAGASPAQARQAGAAAADGYRDRVREWKRLQRDAAFEGTLA